MTRIYTKKGDTGETRVLDKKVYSKSSPLIDCIGEIDELNAYVGLAASLAPSQEVKNLLCEIQKKLFIAGADLAAPVIRKNKREILRIISSDISFLEKTIDAYDAQIPEIKHFVLPGGTESAVQLYIARAICRRAERSVVKLTQKQRINNQIIPFLNRLSDLLFVLARYVNHKENVPEYLWLKNI